MTTRAREKDEEKTQQKRQGSRAQLKQTLISNMVTSNENKST